MAYHAACLLVLLGTQWLGCPNFLRVAVSTPSPPATGDSNAPERPNAPSVIDALISTQRNRCSTTNVSEDEVWVDCDDVGRDIESSLQSPLAAPQLEGAARGDEEGGSLAATTSADRSQRQARARHQRSLEERQVLLAAQDGPLTSGSRAAAVLEQRERRLARDREYAARRREEQRLQEVREGRRAVTEDGAPVLLRSRTPSRSQAPRLALTSGDRLPPARASPSLPDPEFPTVPRRGRRRVLEDSEDKEAALGSGQPGSSAPLPSRPASFPGYEFLFEREEAASTTVDAEVQACVDVAERGVQASVRTRNRATQSERLGVDVSTQTVDDGGEGEVSLGTGPRRTCRGRIDVEVQAGLPSMQRRAKWTQCRIVQRSVGCQAGPSSFRRQSRGVQTSDTPRVSVGTQCEGQGWWEYDLRGRRVTTRPSAGSHLPSGLPWSEVSGWEQVVGSFVEGTESEVIESFAYVGRTWRSDSYGFNWIAGF